LTKYGDSHFLAVHDGNADLTFILETEYTANGTITSLQYSRSILRILLRLLLSETYVLTSQPRLGLPSTLSFKCSNHNFVWISHFSYACCMTHSSHPSWVYHANNIW
jgi:hypothetical protein